MLRGKKEVKFRTQYGLKGNFMHEKGLVITTKRERGTVFVRRGKKKRSISSSWTQAAKGKHRAWPSKGGSDKKNATDQ